MVVLQADVRWVLLQALWCVYLLGGYSSFVGSPLLDIGDNSSVGIAQVGIALGWVYSTLNLRKYLHP